jgi:hypothetical protein
MWCVTAVAPPPSSLNDGRVAGQSLRVDMPSAAGPCPSTQVVLAYGAESDRKLNIPGEVSRWLRLALSSLRHQAA